MHRFTLSVCWPSSCRLICSLDLLQQSWFAYGRNTPQRIAHLEAETCIQISCDMFLIGNTVVMIIMICIQRHIVVNRLHSCNTRGTWAVEWFTIIIVIYETPVMLMRPLVKVIRGYAHITHECNLNSECQAIEAFTLCSWVMLKRCIHT